ncbi:XdhC family protein [Halobacillus sp. A5]|uniref:XdhC family protein n=1 Tax=Halobacillus sp. A5 TaxID=2880263 RepID=UPI0020A66062|nr:XdhC family protein [Halobacillus sp. A5]MCP3028435.1 XdhC family protein [Halobacillus sp. A5]
MEDIHLILKELSCTGVKNGVLATIIHVEGSAYKKEGASMLFKTDGTQVGMLSAGCLEEDLTARIDQQSLGEFPETIVYDMRGYSELSWGEGSGCNGVIHVLVQPLNKRLFQQMYEVKKLLNERKAVTWVQPLSGGMDENSRFLTKNKDLDSFLSLKKDQRWSGVEFEPSMNQFIFVHHFNPKPRLFVFGAGKDAVPLVSFAARAGFSVVVCDWRPALCHKSRFPEADRLLHGFPEEMLPDIQFHPSDYVVILTHNFQKDKEIVSHLIDKPLSYLGILGSAARTKRLLGLKELPNHITSPIGFSIGAKGPEEIAISVVAELVSVKRFIETEEVVGS